MMQEMKLQSNKPLSNEESTEIKSILNQALFATKALQWYQSEVQRGLHHFSLNLAVSEEVSERVEALIQKITSLSYITISE